MRTKKAPTRLTARQLIQAAMTEEQGPFASRARAIEIASMDEIGLAEFTELTGVGVGDHGIYRVGPTGVSLPVSEGLANFTPRQQLEIHQAERHLTLVFPCTPDAFMTWYDATRGEKLPRKKGQPSPLVNSDFPLAEGFLEALNQIEAVAVTARSNSAPEIVDAFRVKPDATENKKWWDDRMRSARKYKLELARVSSGRGGNPSRWDVVQIAVWLIAKKHLSAEKVRRAVERKFSDIDASIFLT